MKKLIALFAVTTLASTSAIAGVAISGTASVSYDDKVLVLLQHLMMQICPLLEQMAAQL